MTHHLVPVLESVQETPRDRTLVLGVPAEAAETFRFRPGQFVTIRDPAWHAGLRRAYSLSGSPREEGVLRITVRHDGKMGGHVYDLPPGALVEVGPPHGKFLLEAEPGKSLVLAAGGAGVAPFRGFLRLLRETGHALPVTLLASSRTSEEILFRAELEALADTCDWFTYLPTVTRDVSGSRWRGRRGRVDAGLLRRVVVDPARTVLYACGPTVFVEATVREARVVGLPDESVRGEKWG